MCVISAKSTMGDTWGARIHCDGISQIDIDNGLAFLGASGLGQRCVLAGITGRSGIMVGNRLFVIMIPPLKIQPAGVRAIFGSVLGKLVERFHRKPPFLSPNPLPQDVLLIPRQGVFKAYAVLPENL